MLGTFSDLTWLHLPGRKTSLSLRASSLPSAAAIKLKEHPGVILDHASFVRAHVRFLHMPPGHLNSLRLNSEM